MARSFIKLTRAKMRSLAQQKRITEFGISFERLPSGDGLFSINVMVDGRRIHRSLGRESDGVTRTTAEDYIAKVRGEARDGRLNLPKRRKVPLTLAAAVPQYIERLRQEGGKEIARKEQRLNQRLVPFFEQIQLA